MELFITCWEIENLLFLGKKVINHNSEEIDFTINVNGTSFKTRACSNCREEVNGKWVTIDGHL